MGRHLKALPADAQAFLRTIAVAVEKEWGALDDQANGARRTYWLTYAGGLERSPPRRAADAEEVGTYTRAVTLDDFRKDVYWAWNYMHGCANGRS